MILDWLDWLQWQPWVWGLLAFWFTSVVGMRLMTLEGKLESIDLELGRILNAIESTEMTIRLQGKP